MVPPSDEALLHGAIPERGTNVNQVGVVVDADAANRIEEPANGIEKPGIGVDVANTKATNVDADVAGGKEHGTTIHDISQWQAMFWTDAFNGDPDRLNEEDEPIGVDEEHLYGVDDTVCIKEATIPSMIVTQMFPMSLIHFLCVNMMDH
ncbi:Os09g0333300 [Oryza sativa Japonica Group]|uniref:Uncharacterized protein n=2 Tax=Oryza sativa subsp. japonica TaxID=39947 RepID=A3BXM1_ORYSJ|nr:hypothetical protein OsJ_28932 [Oryza sativa Japonica Group]BAD28437.1 hypothetical protein [Oryza sativa Japonica Group]BAD29213.1 hypothetical protein [Oryza sativa Japonica Group]BAT07538.1 Os09g0333300 [Oryza sativa Japonica Group]